MSGSGNLPFVGFAAGASPGAAFANGSAHPARVTARWLGLAVLLTALGGLLAVAAGLTTPSLTLWTGLFLYALGLWSIWMVWRTALGDTDVPGHLLFPFIGLAVVILFAHLLVDQITDLVATNSALRSARWPPQATGRDPWASSRGAGGDLLTAEGATLLIRLMIFLLLVVVFQDVLTRMRDLRWVLTAGGLAAAIGAILRLTLSNAVAGAPAVALGGLTGVGLLAAPCLLPEWDKDRSRRPIFRRLLAMERVLRVSGAGLLTALLTVSHYRAAEAMATAAAVVAVMLLVCGAVLPGIRARALAVGGALAIGSIVALARMGLSRPDWFQRVAWAGWSGPAGLYHRPGVAGLEVLLRLSGWLGAGAVVAGFVAVVATGLVRIRKAPTAEQARAALWLCLAGVGAAGLLSDGGANIPSVVVVAALAWALAPLMTGRPLKRFGGWVLVLPFLAALMMMALTHRMVGMPWMRGRLSAHDGMMHFAGTLLLAQVILWRVRAHRWWHGLLCAAGAATAMVLGEFVQQLVPDRSLQVSDMLWDAAGAAAALAVFAALRGLLRLEARLAARPPKPEEKYETWSAR